MSRIASMRPRRCWPEWRIFSRSATAVAFALALPRASSARISA
jgi:hypothetical protein